MSLVNDMLRDLEQRSARASEPLAGVQAAPAAPQTRRSRPVVTVGLFGLAAAAVFLGISHRAPVAALPQAAVVMSTPEPVMPAAVVQSPKEGAVATLASLQRYRFDYRLAHKPAPRRAPEPASAAPPDTDPATAAPVAASASPPAHTTPTVVEHRRREAAERDDTETAAGQTRRTRVVRTRTDPAAQLRRDGLNDLRRGRAASAEALFRELIALTPAQTEPYLLLHDALVAQARHAQAQTELTAALDVAGQPARIALVLAHRLVNAGDSLAAQSLLEQYRGAPGADLEYAALLAAVYERNGDYEQAADGYLFLVSQRPGQGAWWIGLAIASEALGRRAQARGAFERASESHALDPALARYARERLSQLDAMP